MSASATQGGHKIDDEDVAVAAYCLVMSRVNVGRRKESQKYDSSLGRGSMSK